MTYMLFVDDSGAKEYLTPYSNDHVKNPPAFQSYPNFWRNNYFVLCAIRIAQTDIPEINNLINGLKQRYFNTNKVEIKSELLRNPLKRKNAYLTPYNISEDKLKEFVEKYYGILSVNKHKIKIISVVFDKRFYGELKRGTPDGNPLIMTTQVLFEKIQRTGGHNYIIFDQMDNSLKVTKGNNGSVFGVYKKSIPLNKVYVNEFSSIIDITFKKSMNENFLQMADLCAYNIFRQFTQHGHDWHGNNKNSNGENILDVYEFFEKIRCNFYCSPNKQVRGYGLVCIPDTYKGNWNLLKDCF